MLTQEDRINVKLIKKIMTEKKTAFPSLRKKDKKKVQLEIEKVNELLPNIPTSKIIELNELIYARAKLFCNKIGVPRGNPNENTKPEWKSSRERQVRKLH